MDSEVSPINSLPTELLQHILQSLPIVELMRCRGVCRSWRSLVDEFSDVIWRRFCARDHSDEHEKARTKCSPDLTWRQLYRSLHMWMKLNSVDQWRNLQSIKCNWLELIRYRKGCITRGVCGVSAFRGQIMVQEDDKILYYDSVGDKTGEFDTELQQVKYDETDNLIVYIGNHENSIVRSVSENSELRIIKKVNGEPDLEGKIVIPKVNNFIIVGNDVYYDTCTQNLNKNKETTIYKCKAKNNYSSEKIKTFTSEVVTYGCVKGQVNLLLDSDDIFVLEKSVFVLRDHLACSNTLQITRKYNFQPTDAFLYLMSRNIDISVYSYCFYGNLTFLGCNDTTVKVYDTEKFLAESHLLFDSPLKVFDLHDWLQPVHNARSFVTGIDVMEKNYGHIIIASISKGAFAIELTHDCIAEVNCQRALKTRSKMINLWIWKRE